MKKYKKVLVTGPQRSGTRICAQMIAYDTGFEYVDENELYMDSLYMLTAFMEKKKACVIQCPVLCRHIHLFGTEETVVVLMRRPIKDIIISQKRITWTWEWLELAKYDLDAGRISEVKYDFWEKFQKKKIKNFFEIEYESLKDHPLWVEKNKRKSFAPTQTWPSDSPHLIKNAAIHKKEEVCFHQESSSQNGILFKNNEKPRILNGTALLIWNMCDGTRSRDDLVRALKKQFRDVQSAVLAKDVDDFLNDLLARRFLYLVKKRVKQK